MSVELQLTAGEFRAAIIAQSDDDDFEESGWVACVLPDGTALLGAYAHDSCYNTFDALCDVGGVACYVAEGLASFTWGGTVAGLVDLATRRADPAIPERLADPQDSDYDHLMAVYAGVLEWHARSQRDVAQNSCANCSETKIPLASKAEQFSVTFGLVPGYGHNNAIEGDPVTAVVIAWDTAAVAESAAGGLYVPAVATLSRAIYRREWGCPPGGAVTVTLSGARNPQYAIDPASWKQSVSRIAERVRIALRQATARLTFSGCGSLYLT